MLPNISPAETLKMLQDNKARLVDVREADELAALRVPGAEAAPLSVISWMDLRPATAELPIIFTCNSGNRTTKNSDLLQKLAAGPHGRWKAASAPGPNRGCRWKPPNRRCPFFCQIQIGAGGLVLAGVLGSLALALNAVAFGLCGRGACVCRRDRLLRSGHTAFGYALEQK